jgi:spermidine synthase
VGRLGAASVGVFLVASATLMVEVLLIRVFDVILNQHIGYVVITCAMFALGLSGVFCAIRPLREGDDPGSRAGWLAVAFAVSLLLLRPAINFIPSLYKPLESEALRYLVAFPTIYLTLLLPFFLSGLILAYVFSAGAAKIGRLYFFDLAGAALGCIIWIPFIRQIGPGGLMIWGAAALLLAAALFVGRRTFWIGAGAAAALLLSIPLFLGDDRLDFHEHKNKRGVVTARKAGRIELSEWDPVSKIYVVNNDVVDEQSGEVTENPKHVAYDGGTQSSHLFPFDGDFAALREIVLAGEQPIENYFWRRGLLSSHYLKRDTDASVLICGSAAGQEIKAALTFGAGQVDGIELVGTVVRLGKDEYADFVGGIFHDPRVRNQVGEARSFLRASKDRYDIIQIFSNHTSSSIATGAGAISPVYLQTAEAYEEYFSHLTDDGVLHINHHFYPRMITTAALAWKWLGRDDFQRHVVAYQWPAGQDTLPTMLIKMSPWKRDELDDLDRFMSSGRNDWNRQVRMVNPLDPAGSFLSPGFFAGHLPEALDRELDYHAGATTDDRPFFARILRHRRKVEPDPDRFVNESMAAVMSGRQRWPGGEYAVFLGPAVVASFFALLLVGVPLAFSSVGRQRWPGKYTSLGYFACLGLGFIVIELVLVQMFMKLVGFPVYAYAVVILAMLFSAALGSLAVERLGVGEGRWAIPFIGVLVVGTLALMFYTATFDPLLGQPLGVRLIAAAALIFPLGFFMGMPFPIGVLAIRRRPAGAVAWAWGANGIFTVIGGVLSGLFAILFGFRWTMAFALAVYLLAMGIYMVMRRAEGVEPAA